MVPKFSKMSFLNEKLHFFAESKKSKEIRSSNFTVREKYMRVRSRTPIYSNGIPEGDQSTGEALVYIYICLKSSVFVQLMQFFTTLDVAMPSMSLNG